MLKKIQENKELISKIIHFAAFGVFFSLIPIMIALIDYQFKGATGNETIELAPDLCLVASAIVLNAIGVLLSEFDDASHPIFICFLGLNILSVCICFFSYGILIYDSYTFTQVIYEIKTEYEEPYDTQVMLAALKQLEDAKKTMENNQNWAFMMRMAITIIVINSFIGFIAIPIAKKIRDMVTPKAIKATATPEAEENK